MIALKRVRSVAAINAKYRGLDKYSEDVDLMKSWRNYCLNPSNKVKFNSAFWKASKTQLKKESHNKCAYCEASTAIVAYGDVEHYRPKSVYWWLAYTYDNYLYSCQICNQKYKGKNFPISNNNFPSPAINSTTTDDFIKNLAGNISPDPIQVNDKYTLAMYQTNHNLERPFLLNPYLDNPESYFAYQADDNLKEVEVVPLKPQFLQFVEAAENYFGINRLELKNLRYSEYALFRTLKYAREASLPANILEEINQQINKMQDASYAFAGMHRYFYSMI